MGRYWRQFSCDTGGMRRGLARLILGWSLIIGSFAWAGFVLTHTALDPGRSERLAYQMLDNPTLRSALVGQLANSMDAALPSEVPLPRQTLEAAADAALDDPAVERLVIEGIVCTHQNALNGISEGCTLEASALGQASRSALVAANPDLEGLLPVVPLFEVTLPDSGLAWMGSVRRFAVRVTNIGGLVAVGGSIFALAITSDRPRILNRVARWAFGASAFWLVVSFGIPFLVDAVAPSGAAFTAALIDIFFGSMIVPALVMAGFGVALLLLSMVWSTFESDRRGRMVTTAPPTAGAGGVYVPAPSPAPRAAGFSGATGQAQPRGSHHHVSRAPTVPDGSTPAPTRAPSGPRPTADPTAVYPLPERQAPTMRPGSGVQRQQKQPPQQRPQRWIEGIGYVDDDGTD